MTITELVKNFQAYQKYIRQFPNGRVMLKSMYFNRCIAFAIMWFEKNMPNHPLKKYFYQLVAKARPDNIIVWHGMIGVLQAVQYELDPENAKKGLEQYLQRKQMQEEMEKEQQRQEQQDDVQKEQQGKQDDDALIDEVEQAIQDIDGMLQDDTQDVEGGNDNGEICSSIKQKNETTF